MPRRPGGPSPSQLDRSPLPVVHLARDHSRAVVAGRVRSGEWVHARRGAYVDAAEVRDGGRVADRRLALARIVALRSQLRTGYVVSHTSGALLWGLPLARVPAVTHVIQSTRPPARRSPDVVRHVHALDRGEVVTRSGHPVTTLERTVVDCAMVLDSRSALVVADAALHVGADVARCREILATMTGRRGAVSARAVLALADDGAESAGETHARWVLVRSGLPVPETQVGVQTHRGMFWADLGWREWRLLVEYDGRAKYEAQGSARDAVLREKRRQDAIEEAGWRVVRLTAEDLRRPATVLDRILRLAPAAAATRLSPRPDLSP